MGLIKTHSVVLHSAIVEALDEEELLSVIGHEFSHIKCGHTFWLLIIGGGPMRIPLFSQLIGLVMKWWSRKAEFTCDRGGLIACRQVHAVIRSQCKLAVGSQLFEQMDIAPFLEQKQDLDKGFMGKLSEVALTHPMIVNRIQQTKKFSESTMYQHIVSR
jgi:Zn-dependent protease with chaperone function